MSYDARVGFDLLDQTCRRIFRLSLKQNYGNWPWWNLVLSDTLHHVGATRNHMDGPGY